MPAASEQSEGYTGGRPLPAGRRAPDPEPAAFDFVLRALQTAVRRSFVRGSGVHQCMLPWVVNLHLLAGSNTGHCSLGIRIALR